MFANRISSSTSCSIWLPETSPPSSARGLLRHRFQSCNTSLFRDSFILPQLDTAEQALRIADHLDVGRQLEVDGPRIAATDVKPVVVERLRHLVNRFAQVFIPLLLALLHERPVAELVFVSLTVAKRMMPQLQMHPVPVNEQHRSEPGPECNYQFVAVTGHASQALHVGVIGDSHRALEFLL